MKRWRLAIWSAGILAAVAVAVTFAKGSPVLPDRRSSVPTAKVVRGPLKLTVYALGEESFLDFNGNNVYDLGEPFQDLGDVFRDRGFDGVFDQNLDEFIALGITGTSACAAPGSGCGCAGGGACPGGV